MRWLVVDVVLLLVALAGLAVVAGVVWRQASALGREVAQARARLTAASGDLRDALAPLERRR